MRTLLRSLAPVSLLNAARNVRDTAQVSRLPRRDIDSTKLRGRNDIDLAALLNSPDAARDWAEDHSAIRALFGDDNLMGGVNPGDRRAVYTLVHALKPHGILEVGTHIGASTLYMTRALLHHRIQDHTKITTVDVVDVNHPITGPWRRVGLPKAPRDLAKNLHCEDLIFFTAVRSQEFLESTHQTFDFIFLDGDHSARTVYEEVAAALPLLRPGGIVLLHDFYPQGRALFPDGNVIYGPFRAIDRILRENPDMDVLPLGDLPWETKQGSRKTSLALLVKKSLIKSAP